MPKPTESAAPETRPEPRVVDDAQLILDRSYDEGSASFRFRADAHAMVRLDVFGRGSMDSSRALVETLDAYLAAISPQTGPADLLIDLRQANGGPVRAQFLFGKWVMRHRRSLRRAAIVGAQPIERRITRGITAIGRIKRFRFFDTPDEALVWLKQGRAPEQAGHT